MQCGSWNGKHLSTLVLLAAAMAMFACNPRSIESPPTVTLAVAPAITATPESIPLVVTPTTNVNATIEVVVATAIATALPDSEKGMHIVIINDNQGVHISANTTPVVVPTYSPVTPTPIFTATPTFTPTPIMYCVQEGDTLFEIATRFGVSVTALARLNGITDINHILMGTCLLIPGQTSLIPFPSPQTPVSQGDLQSPAILLIEDVNQAGVAYIITLADAPNAVDYEFELTKDGANWVILKDFDAAPPRFALGLGLNHGYKFVRVSAYFDINGQRVKAPPSEAKSLP